MQAWSKRLKQPAIRFAMVTLALVVAFSTLLIEPAVVRLFGTPVQMAYQARFVMPGSDAYVSFPITEVLVEDLPDELQAAFEFGDFDASRRAFSEHTYYLVLRNNQGVIEREAIVFERPKGLYLEATFDWFLWDDSRTVASDRWQDGYVGIQLSIPTLRQIHVPRSTPPSVVRQLEEGTYLGDFIWYQGRLHWRSPNL